MIAIRTDKYSIEMNPEGNILVSLTSKNDGRLMTVQDTQDMVDDLGVVLDYASEYRKKKGLSQL